ncbi:CHAT domain-containing protein [Leptothoe sp. PORK10 BA2]|uniref:CHAT domain-containing protein n=1 Tax=Leptothoe sp. PORK10 BA2 TaxID=3110254 RepID=UPI002B1F48F2|nr:tetratricopeptide repeat protein [Leptothoe sp. PORK10 BA2]
MPVAELTALATDGDIVLGQQADLAEANRLYQEGDRLYQEGSEASLRQAIERWQQALSLWQSVNAQHEMAVVLNDIGAAYYSLGDWETALAYYQQALPLRRATGNQAGEATTLNGIGLTYSALGDHETALAYYQQALPLRRAVGDRAGESVTLNNIGLIYFQQKAQETALDYYQQALSLSQAVGYQEQEAATLNNIGAVYQALGEQETALEYFRQSLPLRQVVGDRPGEAVTLSNIAASYQAISQWDIALAHQQQALQLYQMLGNRQQEAMTLNRIGSIYNDLGEQNSALTHYQQALALWQAMGDTASEAIALNNIGAVYNEIGEGKTALDYLQQALALRQTVGDRAGEAVTLTVMGLVYNDSGESQAALNYYQEALVIHREIGDQFKEGVTLNNIGSAYDSLGERQTALDHYQQALSLLQAINNRREVSVTLNNIGLLYDSLGDPETALDYYQRSLSLSRAVGHRALEATTLTNLGSVYETLGEIATALEHYQQALPLSRAVGDRRSEASILTNTGRAYGRLGNWTAALDYYQQALPLRRAVGDRAGEAVTLNNIGAVYYSLGKPESALEHYQQALPLSQAVGDRPQEANALSNLAHLYQTQGQLDDALETINDAITLIEDLRLDISPGELRSSYFATVQNYYQLKTHILMQLGRPEAAFETSEASRARVLLELLSEANVDIRQGVDPTLLAQEQSLKTELQQIESRRIALRSGDYTQTEAAAIDRESETVLQQLENTLAEIRRASPAYADTVQPRPLTLDQIQQQVLDDDTVLLQYALGEDQSYLWIVGPEQFQSVVLPGREEINTAASTFRNALANPGPVGLVRRPAQTLTAMILPELPAWAEGKRLLVAGDGILSEIPFAALAVPGAEQYEPLLSEHEILSQPSISAVSVLRHQLGNRPEQPLSVAVLADPVYQPTDERLKQASNTDLPREAERNLRDMNLQAILPLPFTRTEADGILQLAQQRNLRSLAAFDFEANYDWVTDPKLGDYGVVHLATHGFINPVNPQLSGVVLSLVDEQGNRRDDGFLRLHDIFNLKLSAELVVLSACQTGRGEQVSGEGIIGLSRGFMYAGAERVAVSLWNVNDEATANLMTEFYRYLLEENQSPAAALRAAQLDMWEAGQSPYYWAAFTLQGEWR